MFFPVSKEFTYMFCGRKKCSFLSALEPDVASLLVEGFEYYKNAINYVWVIIITAAITLIPYITIHYWILIL